MIFFMCQILETFVRAQKQKRAAVQHALMLFDTLEFS